MTTAGREGRAPRTAAPAATILGIDPGTIVTGWGVVAAAQNSLHHIAHGAISTAGAATQADRLRVIYRGIGGVIASYRPDAVSLERVFFARNAQSALKLGQARGVALLAAADHGLTVHEYAAVEIKMAVVGYGQATKEQVQKMITALLRLTENMAADAADALAAAICHLHRQPFHARMFEALPQAGFGAARKRRRRLSLLR